MGRESDWKLFRLQLGLDALPHGTAASPRQEPELSEDERRQKLASLLANCRLGHSDSVSKGVIAGLDQLIELVQSQQIAVADKNDSGYAWGRKSIIEAATDALDSALASLIPIGSLAWSELDRRGTPLPLASCLQHKESCRAVADNLKSAAHVVEDYFEDGIDDWDVMLERTASLSVVAEIVDAIRQVLPVCELRWCELCFRRAVPGSDYCGCHRPGRVASSDTQYRKGKRLADKLTPAVRRFWAAYRSQRKTLGESVTLLASLEDVPVSFSLHARSVVVPVELKNLVDWTCHKPWSEVHAAWEQLISGQFPSASASIDRRPGVCTDWADFVASFRRSANDLGESTDHPYWVLHSLACADDWLTLEAGAADARATDSAARITALYQEGITDPKTLASRVGKSVQYVYRVIKARKLG